MTTTGPVPVEGAVVYRGVQGGWVDPTTDRDGDCRRHPIWFRNHPAL